MKKKTKILTVSAVALLVVLIVAANVWREKSLVRGIRVEIQYDGADTLVRGAEVADSIRAALPTLSSTRIGHVDLKAVERAARSPYLRNCEAATSISGSVVLFAVQRRPIVRVFVGGQEFYLDDRGCSTRYTATTRATCTLPPSWVTMWCRWGRWTTSMRNSPTSWPSTASACRWRGGTPIGRSASSIADRWWVAVDRHRRREIEYKIIREYKLNI